MSEHCILAYLIIAHILHIIVHTCKNLHITLYGTYSVTIVTTQQSDNINLANYKTAPMQKVKACLIGHLS